MSYVNGTQHYNLPQTVGNDKRDWSDTNQAFSDVDAALYQASETAGDASTAVAALDAQINSTGGVAERLSTAENDIDTVEGAVATLNTTVAGHTTAIADVRSDLEDMITAYNEPDATSDHAYAIGDYFIYNDILYKATAAITVGATIVPNTNCAATNVTTEIKDNVVDISGKQDKTDNSLTTTSKQVVGAINELKSALTGKASNTWTLVAGTNIAVSAIPSGGIALPSGYHEVKIKIATNDLNKCYGFNINSNELGSSNSIYRNGYYIDSTNYSAVYVSINESKIVSADIKVDGADVSSSSTIYAWYR